MSAGKRVDCASQTVSNRVRTALTGWLSFLLSAVSERAPDHFAQKHAGQELAREIYGLMKGMAADFNAQIGHEESLAVTVTDPAQDAQPIRYDTSAGSGARTDSAETNTGTSANPAAGTSARTGGYLRFLVYTSSWALSIRGSDVLTEVFMIPTAEITVFAESEMPSRKKIELRYAPASSSTGPEWTLEGLPISDNERNTLLRSLFKDMIVRSKGSSDFLPEALRLPIGPEGESLSRSVRALLTEKQSLVQKVVTQQELLQSRVARELHDTVISNIMMLRRSLSGDKALSKEEMIVVLDEINEHLYQMCEDLTPRDLKDWGLKTVIGGLLNRTAERTGANCILKMCDNLPELPEEVELHVYRIIQESLMNIEKHATADQIEVSFSFESGHMTVSIEDNGRGFERDAAERKGQEQGQSKKAPPQATPAKATAGGRGASIMRERAELISCYFPCNLIVDSQPARGTKIKLEIQYSVSSP